jgi:hypothetical protein
LLRGTWSRNRFRSISRRRNHGSPERDGSGPLKDTVGLKKHLNRGGALLGYSPVAAAQGIFEFNATTAIEIVAKRLKKSLNRSNFFRTLKVPLSR